MPRRNDLKRVLIIGSGPIVIGQACEFDYSGSQACKALRAEGLEVILVNSNPATIMTDPELADRTYVEPLTPEVVAQIIEKERPDAVLPTVGGQTALNLAVALAEQGVALGGEIANAESLAFSWLFHAWLHGYRGDWRTCQQSSATGIAVAARNGTVQTLAWNRCVHGWARAHQGDVAGGWQELAGLDRAAVDLVDVIGADLRVQRGAVGTVVE